MEPFWIWNNVRKGRSPSLHLLASPTAPTEARAALLVDFRAIYSLPLDYLVRRAVQIGDRWRLRSPFLEHFSQAFARSFMQVGLPSSVSEFWTAVEGAMTKKRQSKPVQTDRKLAPVELTWDAGGGFAPCRLRKSMPWASGCWIFALWMT